MITYNLKLSSNQASFFIFNDYMKFIIIIINENEFIKTHNFIVMF